jgi:hypothetical protein
MQIPGTPLKMVVAWAMMFGNPKYAQQALDEYDALAGKAGDLDGRTEFHPRAMKLMAKRKDFIVIAHDEPYYMVAYSWIRYHETFKGTWTAVDEELYQAALKDHPIDPSDWFSKHMLEAPPHGPAH